MAHFSFLEGSFLTSFLAMDAFPPIYFFYIKVFPSVDILCNILHFFSTNP
jgi:hypothetical protein